MENRTGVLWIPWGHIKGDSRRVGQGEETGPIPSLSVHPLNLKTKEHQNEGKSSETMSAEST